MTPTEKDAWKQFWAIILCAVSLYMVLAAIFPRQAQAEEPTLWITSGMWSQHPNEDHYHYNQTNYGWGLAYENGNHTWVAGRYDNSLNQDSKYIGVINQPWRYRDLRFGYLAGFVSGYTKTPKFQMAVAPVVSYEYQNVGFNVIWVPSVVIAVQVKVKVF